MQCRWTCQFKNSFSKIVVNPLNKTRFQEPFLKISWLMCLGIVLVLCPVLIYFYSIHLYATNIPLFDDFASLNRIIQIIQSDTQQNKITLLFSKNLENLVLFYEITVLLIYSVLGEIDFKILILIGNSALLGLLFFTYKTLPKKRERIFLLLPAALLLFQLKPNWIYIMWGTNISYLYVVCFSGLVFYFLCKNSIKFFCAAIFLAICSLLSLGSGVATLAVGWIVLIIQKRFKLAWVWLALSLVMLGFFAYPLNFTSSSFTISSINDLVRIGNFFISFLGVVSSFENRTLVFALGILVICYFIFLLHRKYYAINPAVFGFIVFVFFVAAITALYRSRYGISSVFADRYKIHSLVMLLLIYISIVDLFYSKLKRKWVFVVSMIMITSTMYFLSYNEGKQKLEFSKYLLTWRMNQWVDKNFNLMNYSEKEANVAMTKALVGGFYKLPYQFINIPDKKYSPSVTTVDLCNRESEKPFESEFNIIAVGPELSPFLVRVEGVIYDNDALTTKSEPVHVVLRSREGRYMFTTHSQEHANTSIHFRQGKSNKGLLALIPINKLNNNTYQLGLCNKGGVVYSNKLIIKEDHQFKIIR